MIFNKETGSVYHMGHEDTQYGYFRLEGYFSFDLYKLKQFCKVVGGKITTEMGEVVFDSGREIDVELIQLMQLYALSTGH